MVNNKTIIIFKSKNINIYLKNLIYNSVLFSASSSSGVILPLLSLIVILADFSEVSPFT